MSDTKQAAVEEATEIIHAMPDQIEAAWRSKFSAKIGISTAQDGDQALVEDLLALMQVSGADFTNTFRALGDGTAGDQFLNREAFDPWFARWQERIETEPDAKATLASANPSVIPRNHRIEEMIAAAVAGDMAPFERLMAACATPYQRTDAALERPPTSDEIVPATYCGT